MYIYIYIYIYVYIYIYIYIYIYMKKVRVLVNCFCMNIQEWLKIQVKAVLTVLKSHTTAYQSSNFSLENRNT